MSLPSGVPGYWMNEESGILAPVVRRYLKGSQLTPMEVATMRAYLRQWINGDFKGPQVAPLRRSLEQIATTDDLRRWLAEALEVGIDPL